MVDINALILSVVQPSGSAVEGASALAAFVRLQRTSRGRGGRAMGSGVGEGRHKARKSALDGTCALAAIILESTAGVLHPRCV